MTMMPWLAAWLLLLPASFARAMSTINKDAGTSGAQFLKLGAGARAGAMADSFSAVADDVHASYYNPAGLTQLRGTQLGGAHTTFIRDLNYEVLAFGYPWGRQGDWSRHCLAISVDYLAVSKIERRASDTSDAVGSMEAADAAYAASYAYAFTKDLSFGLTAKLVSERIDTYHSDSFAADAGFLYKPIPESRVPISISAVVRNFGTRVSYARGQSDPMPVSFTGGAAVHLWRNRLVVNVEGTKYRDAGLFGAIGGEYVQPLMANMTAAVRAGYTSHYRDIAGLNGMAMGMGVTYHVASFDFAWLPFGRLGDTFRYSLLLKF